MSCQTIQSECVRLGARIPITLDFSQFAARSWRRGAIFASQVRIRGKTPGFEYEALSTGQTGQREPTWPSTIGETVVDGSVTWETKAISDASFRKTLSLVEWDAPVGITVSGELIVAANGEQTATAYLEPTVAGTYTVVAWVSFSDLPSHREGFAIELEVVE